MSECWKKVHLRFKSSVSFMLLDSAWFLIFERLSLRLIRDMLLSVFSRRIGINQHRPL
jgi:hypothetical protein